MPKPAAPPRCAAKQANRSGVQPQAQGRLFQEGLTKQLRYHPVIVQVHGHSNARDTGLGGALQFMVTQGQKNSRPASRSSRGAGRVMESGYREKGDRLRERLTIDEYREVNVNIS